MNIKEINKLMGKRREEIEKEIHALPQEFYEKEEQWAKDGDKLYKMHETLNKHSKLINNYKVCSCSVSLDSMFTINMFPTFPIDIIKRILYNSRSSPYSIATLLGFLATKTTLNKYIKCVGPILRKNMGLVIRAWMEKDVNSLVTFERENIRIHDGTVILNYIEYNLHKILKVYYILNMLTGVMAYIRKANKIEHLFSPYRFRATTIKQFILSNPFLVINSLAFKSSQKDCLIQVKSKISELLSPTYMINYNDGSFNKLIFLITKKKIKVNDEGIFFMDKLISNKSDAQTFSYDTRHELDNYLTDVNKNKIKYKRIYWEDDEEKSKNEEEFQIKINDKYSDSIMIEQYNSLL